MAVIDSFVEEKEQAKKNVDRFVSRFDESYRLLVYHAAIPLIVTPELLNYLRHQFLRGRVSWVAEVDLLLSDLFSPVGYELYAMESPVRAYLLENLETFFQAQGLKEKHLQEVALILLGYIKHLARTHSFLRPPELQAQQWAAMVCLEDKKEQVYQEIKAAFQQCGSEAEWARLTQITGELSPQLSGYPSFIKFTELLRDLLLEGKPDSKEKREAIAQLGRELEIDLSGLGIGERQTFDFETVTVNRFGEVIKRETRLAQYFSQDLGNGVSLDMVAIPGGTFQMGSPKGEGSSRERPQHEVTVQPFFMAKYPITQVQWRAIASRKDLQCDRDLDDLDPSRFKGDNRPVERVNWYQAVEFCKRLSKLTEQEYRLPSEAEWEYACRAGTTTPFSCGETLTDELANYRASETYADEPTGQYREETTPVGQFPPNAFGLYDMHGNVLEWCMDEWHENYNKAPTDGSAWVKNENDNRSQKEKGDRDRSPLRGGSWLYYPYYCRSAYRDYNILRRDDYDVSIGFRVVCGAGRTSSLFLS